MRYVFSFLLHLRRSITIPTTSPIKNYDDFLVMTNLTSFALGYSGSAGNASMSLAPLTKLQSFSMSSSYGFNGWPDLSAVPKLTTVSIKASYPLYQGGQQIPDDLFDGLTSLKSVTIQSNNYMPWTTFPDMSGNLGITTLALSSNFLTIPDYFGNFVNLTTLDLSGNFLLNKLPATMSACTKLTSLSVASTNITSDDSFFDMSNTAVNYIMAQSTGMTHVPTSLCNLPNAPFGGLVQLYLEYNPIRNIPSCFANKKISLLSFYSSNFSTFPAVLGEIPSLVRLNLRANQQTMTGNVDFSQASNLYYADFSNSKWYGAFPTSISKLATLAAFVAPGNDLQGSLPDNFFTNLTAFQQLDITGSSLIGPFPSSVGLAKALQYIQVARNRFTSISDSIVNLTNLDTIDFSDNRLVSAPNDTVWSNLKRMRYVYLGGNTELTGMLPIWWSQTLTAPSINTVNMSFTGYYGNFPLFNNSNMRQALFSGAGLNGRILGFQTATRLTILRLDRNSLTGTVPNSIGVTDNGALQLTTLDLSYNLLSGNLPPYFTSLTALSTLALNNNGFSGPLPNIALMGSLTSLELQNNFFDLCFANPGITSRLYNKCNLTNQAPPNACGCTNFFTYCAVNTTCPSPDYVPLDPVPFSVPVPVKPPTTAPTPQPIFTPADATVPGAPLSPSSPPSSTPTSNSGTPSNEPTNAASPLVASIALIAMAVISSALLL